MNAESPDMIDGIVVMKILIAMLENLKGQVNEALPYIIKIAMTELTTVKKGDKKIPKNFRSMIVQVLSMCFWYNSALTFQILESNNYTVPMFQALL